MIGGYIGYRRIYEEDYEREEVEAVNRIMLTVLS